MLTIDGIIFTLQRAGGISVIFRTLLDYLEQNKISTKQLIDGKSLQELPDSGNCVKKITRTKRQFERYRDCRMEYYMPDSHKKSEEIFHSTYYRRPEDKKITSILTVYDFMYERYRKGPARLVHTIQKNAAIKRAQSLICISESTRDDLLEYVGIRSEQKIQVIHCGASDIFQPLHKNNVISTSSKVPFMLFVGLRAGYKNFKLALATLAELPMFELRCVGGGSFSKSEFEGVPENVSSRVKHMGFISEYELNTLYNSAVCLFYPSSYEGFGIPVIEAMKAGCPVICTNCKALIEIGGDAIQMVPEHDPKALASAVLRMGSSDRNNVVESGIQNASKFTWTKSNEKTLNVYREYGITPKTF